MTDEELIEAARVVKYEPGDRIIIQTDGILSRDQAEQISHRTVNLFPGAVVAIFDGSLNCLVEHETVWVQFSRQLADKMIADDEWSPAIRVKLVRQTGRPELYDLVCEYTKEGLTELSAESAS